MKVPVSWLRALVELPTGVSTKQIADAYTKAGLQVERIEQRGGEVTGPVVVGRVLDIVAEPQKNGKTIRWCTVDCGPEHNASGTNPDIQNARGIVCGADNFEVGDHVVVALPGAVLPGDFAIAARKTYGHVSDGMICALDELGLGEDHSGIIVLPDLIDGQPPVLGADALDVMGARDEVFDVDVTPDSSHCLSMRGFAREAAQAFGVPFNDPYAAQVPAQQTNGYPVVLESDACPLFVALTVRDYDPAAPSPEWMVRRLESSGMRSISLPVDITNHVMLESGQPLHAYDAAKLEGPIRVRQAREGERLTTLDDVDRALSREDLLITDDRGPIGLAGVMGGQTTEWSAGTTSIVFEAAHFDPGTIGRTFRRHKLPSEASKRFERGVDMGVPYAAALKAAQLLVEYGGGTLDPGITVVGEVQAPPTQQIPADLPARILGAEVGRDEVERVLTASGVEVSGVDVLTLQPPTWRRDLVDQYDYVEEVGRKIGYDRIGATVPRATAGLGYTREQSGRYAVIDAVVAAGFVEVLALPFIGAEEIDRLGATVDDPRRRLVRLANPLSDAQPYLRSTLLPGLFQAVARNTSRSQDDLSLFECGSVFLDGGEPAATMPDVTRRPTSAETAELYRSLPAQPRMLAGVVCGDWRSAGWQGPAIKADWTHAVLLAQSAAQALGLELQREAAEMAPWHPGRCARLLVADPAGQLVEVGHAGELHPTVVTDFGLPARTCAVELDLDAMVAAAPKGGEVRSLSPFPLTKEDVALIVDADVPAARVEAALRAGGGELLETVTLFDVYTGPQIGEGKKSLAYGMGFRANRTLTEAEAAQARDAGVAAAAAATGAIQRVQ